MKTTEKEIKEKIEKDWDAQTDYYLFKAEPLQTWNDCEEICFKQKAHSILNILSLENPSYVNTFLNIFYSDKKTNSELLFKKISTNKEELDILKEMNLFDFLYALAHKEGNQVIEIYTILDKLIILSREVENTKEKEQDLDLLKCFLDEYVKFEAMVKYAGPDYMFINSNLLYTASRFYAFFTECKQHIVFKEMSIFMQHYFSSEKFCDENLYQRIFEDFWDYSDMAYDIAKSSDIYNYIRDFSSLIQES